MSKKKLLEESTIRSFMKLANLQPLSEKFISETWKEGAGEEEEKEEEELDEAKKEEEEEDEGMVKEGDGQVPHDAKNRRDDERDAHADVTSEQLEQEGEVTEEGKESEGRPASPKQKVKGVEKPGKMDAAKNALPDAKLKPMKQTSNHSVKSGNVKVGDETGPKSNVTKKNNSQFEMMTENLEEVELEEDMEEVTAEAAPEGEMTPSDEAGESEEHQATVKDALKKMLDAMQQIAGEYGVDMSVSSDEETAGEEAPEMAGAEEEDEAMMEVSHKEDEAMMEVSQEPKMDEEKLEEMLDKLTKRVAARLVKESSKKKR
jgi:hypothetical protein